MKLVQLRQEVRGESNLNATSEKFRLTPTHPISGNDGLLVADGMHDAHESLQHINSNSLIRLRLSARLHAGRGGAGQAANQLRGSHCYRLPKRIHSTCGVTVCTLHSTADAAATASLATSHSSRQERLSSTKAGCSQGFCR